MAEAEYHPHFPVHLAIDAGTSRTTGGVWFQVRGQDPLRKKVTVFGDYCVAGLFSEANAQAIKCRGEDLPCGGRIDTVRLDPAATARTGIGVAAYGEFERVFGSRITARWPMHRVADGLDQIEALPDPTPPCLIIHPRCTALKTAFLNYSRAKPGANG